MTVICPISLNACKKSSDCKSCYKNTSAYICGSLVWRSRTDVRVIASLATMSTRGAVDSKRTSLRRLSRHNRSRIADIGQGSWTVCIAVEVFRKSELMRITLWIRNGGIFRGPTQPISQSYVGRTDLLPDCIPEKEIDLSFYKRDCRHAAGVQATPADHHPQATQERYGNTTITLRKRRLWIDMCITSTCISSSVRARNYVYWNTERAVLARLRGRTDVGVPLQEKGGATPSFMLPRHEWICGTKKKVISVAGVGDVGMRRTRRLSLSPSGLISQRS